MTITKTDTDKILNEMSILVKKLEIINQNNLVRYHIMRASSELISLRLKQLKQ